MQDLYEASRIFSTKKARLCGPYDLLVAINQQPAHHQEFAHHALSSITRFFLRKAPLGRVGWEALLSAFTYLQTQFHIQGS